MSGIVDLDEHRAHVNIHCDDGNIHVIPVLAFKDFITGKLKLTDIEDWELIFPIIVEEWLNRM